MYYFYGMRLRGFSPGCQPKEGLVRRIDSTSKRYWDILIYNRKLTNKEEISYDLDYLYQCKSFHMLKDRFGAQVEIKLPEDDATIIFNVADLLNLEES